jgi:hypothetical protein
MSTTPLSFVWRIPVGTGNEVENEIENDNENETGALRVGLAGGAQELDAKADQLRWEPRAPDPADAGGAAPPRAADVSQEVVLAAGRDALSLQGALLPPPPPPPPPPRRTTSTTSRSFWASAASAARWSTRSSGRALPRPSGSHFAIKIILNDA